LCCHQDIALIISYFTFAVCCSNGVCLLAAVPAANVKPDVSFASGSFTVEAVTQSFALLLLLLLLQAALCRSTRNSKLQLPSKVLPLSTPAG
jgi:hypothetical protein